MGNVTPDEKREMVTRKAFELYQKRGCKPGHEMDDWLEAEKAVEQDLKTRSAKSTPAPATTPTQSTPTPTTTSSKPQRSIPTPIRNTSKVGYKRVRG